MVLQKKENKCALYQRISFFDFADGQVILGHSKDYLKERYNNYKI